MPAFLLHSFGAGSRSLKRNFGQNLILIVLLALGIGGTVSIFAVIDVLLLRPVPFKNSEDLVFVSGASTPLTEDRLAFWNMPTAFSSLVSFSFGGANFGDERSSERIPASIVSSNFFELFEEQPILGRSFNPDDELANRSVVILGYGVWQRRFGSDLKVIGHSVHLDGSSFEVVGVMPRDFVFPADSQLWIPRSRLRNSGFQLTNGRGDASSAFPSDSLVGRLAKGVNPNQAEQMLRARQSNLEGDYKRAGISLGVSDITVVPIKEKLVSGLRKLLLLLFGGMCCILLITCTSIANILLIRGVAREKEVSIRYAVGAQKSHVILHLVTEAAALVALGTFGALLIAGWLLTIIHDLLPTDLATTKLTFDPTVGLFVLVAGAITTLGIGLVPGMRSAKANLYLLLREDAGGTRIVRRAIRHGFVVAQISSAVVLLVNAGLLVRSFERLTMISPGFNPANAMCMEVVLNSKDARDADHITTFQDGVLSQVTAQPTVVASGFISPMPLQHASRSIWLSKGDNPSAGVLEPEFTISGDYFRAMGITVLAGDPVDEMNRAVDAIILSRKVAQALFGDGQGIGNYVNIGGENFKRRIVAIVDDIQNNDLMEERNGQVYVPFRKPFHSSPLDMNLVIRTKTGAEDLDLEKKIVALGAERGVPFFATKTLTQLVNQSASSLRVRSGIFGMFAALALSLAFLGVYAVIAYSARLRKHEFGVRLALGAKPYQISVLLFREALLTTTVGVVLGVLLSVSLRPLVSDFLFNTVALDPQIYALCFGSVLLGCLLACTPPALRAARQDLINIMKCE